MELLVVNRTKYVLGAHATTMLVNDFVNARLGDYGPAVEQVEVTLLYPGSSRRGSGADPHDADFWRLVEQSPRVTFSRAKRRVDVRWVCRGISPRSIAGDGHLTPEEADQLVAAVSGALELIRPRFKPTDPFDVQAFLADAHDALDQCPAAIARWLA